MPKLLEIGLSSLPNEIIIRVLELGYSMSERSDRLRFSMHASHVCGRFRDIALKIRTLWSDIPYGLLSEAGAEKVFARGRTSEFSCSLPLLVMENSRISTPITSTVTQLTNCHSLWIRGEDDPNGGDNSDDEATRHSLDILFKNSNNRTFPHLRELVLDFQLQSLDQEPENIPEFFFYTGWNMPALTSLEARNFIPLPPIGPLTSFQLTLSTYTFGDIPWDFHDLGTFLQEQSALVSLSMSFLAEIDADLSFGSTIVLPLLESLSVHVEVATDTCPEDVCSNVRAPKLVELSVSGGDLLAYDGGREGGVGLLDDSLGWDSNGRNVSSLSVALKKVESCVCADKDISLLDEICELFPQLQHLSISAPNAPESEILKRAADREDRAAVPPLSSLRLECYAFEGLCTYELLIEATRGRSISDFDRLEVVGGGPFTRSMRYYLRHLSEEKIFWVE